MELRQLEYFLEVCETRSFTKASEHLRVTQPSITKSIQNLEYELGTSLLDRSVKPIGLTEAGERLRQRLLPVMRELEETVREISDMAADKQEMVRIGIPPMAGAKLITLLTNNAPRLHTMFNFVEGSNPELSKMLIEDKVDMAWLFDVDLPYGVTYMPVETQEAYCMLPFDHPLAVKERLTFEELQGEKFAFSMTTNNSALLKLVLDRCHKAGYHPKSSLETYQLLPKISLAQMWVEKGLGITFIPKYAAIQVQRAMTRPMDPPLTFRMGFAWKEKRPLSKGQQDIVSFVKANYSEFAFDNQNDVVK